MLAIAKMLLEALLPLLQRRVLAAERQAAASEQQEQLLRTYLAYSDPGFRDLLLGVIPEADSVPDVYAEHGVARDVKYARMEELRELWFAQHGQLLDDEQLQAEYDRLYTEASARMDPDEQAEVHH